MLGCAAVVAAAIGLGSSAQAAPPAPASGGFSTDNFDPSPRGSQWFVLDSLDLRDDGRPAVGLVSEYALRPFVIKNADGTDRAHVVEDQLFLHPGGALVILDALRLSVDLPIAVLDTGSATSAGGDTFAAPTSASLGDMGVAADLRLFGRYGEAVTGAVGLEVLAPTGQRAQYTGDGKSRFLPRLQVAGTSGDVTWALRLGMLFRTEDDPIAGQTRGQAITFGGAVGWRPSHGAFVFGPEVYGSASVTQPANANAPVEAILGAHYTFAPEWRVNLGAGPGLSAGLGVPALRAVLSLEFAMQAEEDRPKQVALHHVEVADRDHDLVADGIDACPDTPGKANIDPSLNGCPAPKDADGDSVADEVDACPDEKGSPSEDPDMNGCPPDADDDGVPDSIDACPLRAGVEQADKTQNGCPPDSDRDGVIDEEDACPDRAGPASKDPQDNGCPIEPDRDHDGIQNEDDACPREPGPKDPDPKKNGCPKAILRGGEIRILDQVRFQAASARIVPGKASTDVLMAVKKVLVEHPEITKLEVQGHTDNRGDPKANKRLSEQRAQAVAKWLAQHGVAAARLTAVGYGDERPLESNTNEEGRTTNRRVEFHATATAKPAAPAPATDAPGAPAPEEKKP